MEKYLRLYAEPELANLEPLLASREGEQPWGQVLVIPACNEDSQFLRAPPPGKARSLMILVINEAEAVSETVTAANRHLARTVHDRFDLEWQSPKDNEGVDISFHRDDVHPRDILLVDRFSPGNQLPVDGGVGHARKLGADLASKLFAEGVISSPWIHCSDGDTKLPQSYFFCSAGFGRDYSALVYPYQHVEADEGDDKARINRSTMRYELSLRYYVAGLKLAKSPYAFHTIGSTMAVHAVHYAAVRGFPKRSAGEDFYLLNKLAKVGKIHELDESPACQAIEIRSRRSDRVPFGTGAAVNRIASLDQPASDYHYYHPEIFTCLQCWLARLSVIWSSQSPVFDAGGFSEILPANADRLALISALKTIGTNKALEHAFRQSKNFDQFQRQFHTWFDAFRTLKFIHALRESNLPSMNLEQLGGHPVFKQLTVTDKKLGQLYELLSGN